MQLDRECVNLPGDIGVGYQLEFLRGEVMVGLGLLKRCSWSFVLQPTEKFLVVLVALPATSVAKTVMV